jgi:hypothetical protein
LLFLLLCVFLASGAGAAEQGGRRVVVVDKASKVLTVYIEGQKAVRFPVSFGVDPVSDKVRAHDLATPEGLYFITHHKSRTRFHRTLGLSYPNLADAQRGLVSGLVSARGYGRIRKAVQRGGVPPCDTGLGCAIAIHGGGVYRRFGEFRERDWTEGCIALENRDMERLFALCRDGDPVVIFNGARNLCDVIRPFTQVRDHDAAGLPVCPDGVCVYEARLRTWLGLAFMTIREGAGGMSLEAAVSGEGGAVLVVTDRNGDGELSFLDAVRGSMAEGVSPDSAYRLLRSAVVVALAGGEIPEGTGPRELAVFGRLD